MAEKQKLGPLQTRFIEALQGKGKIKYTQCRKRLSSVDGGSYCCLGVACDLFKEEVGCKWVRKPDQDYSAIVSLKTEDLFSGVLPDEIVDLLKFIDRRGSLKVNADGYANHTMSLVSINDRSYDYQPVIDAILEDPAKYFTEPA